MVSRRTSSSRDTSSWDSRSTLSAPTTSLPLMMGTQIKETLPLSLVRLRRRARVRSRNSGSSTTLGTMAGSPVRDDLSCDSLAERVAAAFHLVRAKSKGVFDDDGAGWRDSEL